MSGRIILNNLENLLFAYDGDRNGSIGISETYSRLKGVDAKLIERTMVALFLPQGNEEKAILEDIYTEYADLQTYIMKYAANVEDESVGIEEFTKRLEELGSNESEKSTLWIFKKVDINRDKKVSYSELKQLSTTLPEMGNTIKISDIRAFFR